MIILKEIMELLTVSQNVVVKDDETLEVLFDISAIGLLFDDSDPVLNKEVTHISAVSKNELLILTKR